MRKIAGLLCVFFCWQSFVFAEVKIQVLDVEGNPVPNAVISLTNIKELKPELNVLSSESETEQVAVMDQVDSQFSPQVLIVKSGQSVVFPNSDQVRHHVYSFSKPNDFEIRLYSGNQAEPLKFENSGIVVLGCNIHDQMVGYLYVQNDEVAGISDQNGYVVFDEELSASVQDQTVNVWHSQLSSNKTERVTQVLSEKNKDSVWILRLDLIPEVKKVSRKFKPRY
ncbi:MAG: plastocyanin [Oleiphilaceae bacterium]